MAPATGAYENQRAPSETTLHGARFPDSDEKHNPTLQGVGKKGRLQRQTV